MKENILGNEKSNDYMYTESVISTLAFSRNQLPHANTLPSSHPPRYSSSPLPTH